ncbi:hypothetical protein BU17DRAFT_100596 [Hysterangium stoloniferum]|nr:hypothetical protein BU17DRAFT_100596 [Hysterangium stoloniferum]
MATTEIWSDADIQETNNTQLEDRPSLYVETFQSIQSIVMAKERFLFSPMQQACLDRIQTLSYPARYLLIRLCLCKRAKWHSLASLEGRYSTEIGRKENISKAIDELCGITSETETQLQPQSQAKTEGREIIDLTLDDTDDELAAGSNVEENQCNFAEDEQVATLRELLECLQHEELKDLGKQMKVLKASQKRSTLSEAIISTASKQLVLGTSVLSFRNNEVKESSKRQLTLNFSRDAKSTQTQLIKQKIRRMLGRCIRIHPAIFSLLDRLNIVFFRSTSYNPSLLLPALLDGFRKRKHAPTNYTRTVGIFPSCQALSDYQDALMLEARIDDVLSGENKVKGNGKADIDINSRSEDAKLVHDIFRGIYDRWKDLIALDVEEETLPLARFHCGHVLTRIVCKGAEALGLLKEYVQEMEVLKVLLSQKKWRRGQRGAWYNRLALIMMTHMERTTQNCEAAMDIVISGLEDELTHLLYRPRLQRRLCRLEKRLNIPLNERHKCERQLQNAADVHIEGTRIKSTLGELGRPKAEATPNWSKPEMNRSPTAVSQINGTAAPHAAQSWKGNTRWLGKDGTEISVEELALEYYREQGYKGFHSEGRIVFTVFGLLFWDIIFASIPGAFETPYQSAPLDLFEDSFYEVRKEMITHRLDAIAQGQAHQLLEEVYDRESPTRTVCVGVDWDFSKQDLLEIVDCIDGKTLVPICQAISEDYRHMRGGIPDLLIWNIECTDCKFVEVKSPKDRLQENQRVWIDILLGAEMSVELCHVLEKRRRVKSRRLSPSQSSVKYLTPESEDNKDHSDQKSECRNKRSRDSDDFIPTIPTSYKRSKEELPNATAKPHS